MTLEIAYSIDRLVRIIRLGAFYRVEERASTTTRWYHGPASRKRASSLLLFAAVCDRRVRWPS